MKKRKDIEQIGNYRCSCCDQMKKWPNIVWKTWDSSKRKGTSEVVVICRKCNFSMIKHKTTGVLQYLSFSPMRTYKKKDCVRFIEDMEKAGLTVEHYRGRFFWQGPAVRVDDIQEAFSKTDVKCQYDQMGLVYIVYPVSLDEGVDNE